MELLENAILIADVHYHKDFRESDFLKFLNIIEANTPSQIIFLGDIFDILFGEIKYTENKNRDIIFRLNQIGKKVQILYFEGNHDFNLKSLFHNIKIIDNYHQPFQLNFKNEKIFLAHGDWGSCCSFKYSIYRKIINSSKILKFLNFFDMKIGNKIIKSLEISQIKKNKCYKIANFKDLIISKFKFLNLKNGIFLEGHYHQGESFDFEKFKYINLESFACSQSYFIVKSKGNSLYLAKKRLEEF